MKSFLIAFFMTIVALPCQSLAGIVHSCKKMQTKQKNNLIRLQCIMDLPEGRVADTVEIKDHYNYIVANGKILKRQGRFAVVVIGNKYAEVKAGYPVILKVKDSDGHWTATTAPF